MNLIWMLALGVSAFADHGGTTDAVAGSIRRVFQKSTIGPEFDVAPGGKDDFGFGKTWRCSMHWAFREGRYAARETTLYRFEAFNAYLVRNVASYIDPESPEVEPEWARDYFLDPELGAIRTHDVRWCVTDQSFHANPQSCPLATIYENIRVVKPGARGAGDLIVELGMPRTRLDRINIVRRENRLREHEVDLAAHIANYEPGDLIVAYAYLVCPTGGRK